MLETMLFHRKVAVELVGVGEAAVISFALSCHPLVNGENAEIIILEHHWVDNRAVGNNFNSHVYGFHACRHFIVAMHL